MKRKHRSWATKMHNEVKELEMCICTMAEVATENEHSLQNLSFKKSVNWKAGRFGISCVHSNVPRYHSYFGLF